MDLIITSPPYATALPYIDTDRLSLAFLNLLNKRQKPAVERALIGSREIQTSLKNRLEQEFFDNYNCCPLPREIKETIKHIYDLNHNAQVGFRRKNMPSLLYRYFMDMRTAVLQMHRLLKENGVCMIIIGDNVTTAWGCKMSDTDPYCTILEAYCRRYWFPDGGGNTDHSFKRERCPLPPRDYQKYGFNIQTRITKRWIMNTRISISPLRLQKHSSQRENQQE